MANEIITSDERLEFAPEIIKRRGFIRAKYWSWTEPKNGLITHAAKDKLIVLFQTNINTAVSYYPIKIGEVAKGLWDISYTNDLETIYKFTGGAEQEEVIDLPKAVRALFKETDDNGSESIGDNESVCGSD